MLTYAGGRLHLGPISSKESLKAIKTAKKEGLNLTAEVNQHSLFLTDELLSDFDASYKLMPPLRDEKSRLALIKALKDGTIDLISSDHQPEGVDEKRVEFIQSAFGAIGLESTFSIALEAIEDLDLVIEKMSEGPRKVFGLKASSIEIGEKANITVFDPKAKWILDKDTVHSKSLNSPYLGKQMIGRAIAVINGSRFFIS
jgi:dihydroorotase